MVIKIGGREEKRKAGKQESRKRGMLCRKGKNKTARTVVKVGS